MGYCAMFGSGFSDYGRTMVATLMPIKMVMQMMVLQTMMMQTMQTIMILMAKKMMQEMMVAL